MKAGAAQLKSLTRRERKALVDLVIAATAPRGRGDDNLLVAQAARAAPLQSLPPVAALHRVGGAVHRGLEGIEDVPGEVRAALATMQGRALLKHLALTGALHEVGRGLDGCGVTWMAMKGPLVAALFYEDVGDRMCADLDLLVDRRDFERAVELLEDLGYRHEVHDWALAERMLAGEVHLRRGPVTIDLHWHLHYSRNDRQPYAFDIGQMLQRRRGVVVSGAQASTFDPVDTVITLAFNSARSGGHRLVWLRDLERAMAIDAPDFDEVVRRCHTYRCGLLVGVMLERVRVVLDAAVPADVVCALLPLGLRKADRALRLVADPITIDDRPTALRWFTRSLRATSGMTLSHVPARAIDSIRRRMNPPPWNETDNPGEKASYLRAVAMASEP